MTDLPESFDHDQRNQDVMRKGDIMEWDRPGDASCGGVGIRVSNRLLFTAQGL